MAHTQPVLTFVYIACAVLVLARSHSTEHQWDAPPADGDTVRNEQSTPRSFVLPATPAVAHAQESRFGSPLPGVDTPTCLVALRARGYDIPLDDVRYNVDLTRALRSFQHSRDLPPIGVLTADTARLIGCQR